MQKLTLTFWVLLSVTVANAQMLNVTSYDLSETIDDPTLQEFAAFPDGTAYMSYRYFDFGQRDHAMIYFDGSEWSPIDTLCTTCVRHIVAGPDEALYVAANNQGIFRRDDNQWTQIVTEAANHLAFSPSDVLHFIGPDGVSTFDGTSVTLGNTTNLPAGLNNITEMRFRADGTLFFIQPPTLYKYTADEGFTALTEVSSPLHIAAHPDGKMYVNDNFGQIGFFEGDDYTNNAITGIFPSGFGLVDFDISSDGIFWGSQMGSMPGVKRYDGTVASDLIAPGELIDDAVLIGPIHPGFNGQLFTASDLRPGVAIISGGISNTDNFTAEINAFRVGPNPARSEILLSGQLETAGLASIQILNTKGQLLRQRTVQLPAGGFNQRLELHGLADGIYYVELICGNQRGVSRLVITK